MTTTGTRQDNIRKGFFGDVEENMEIASRVVGGEDRAAAVLLGRARPQMVSAGASMYARTEDVVRWVSEGECAPGGLDAIMAESLLAHGGAASPPPIDGDGEGKREGEREPVEPVAGAGESVTGGGEGESQKPQAGEGEKKAGEGERGSEGEEGSAKGRPPEDDEDERLQDVLVRKIYEDYRAGMRNVLLVGPPGCGKTRAGEVIADVLGVEFVAQSLSVGVTEDKLLGLPDLRPDSEGFILAPVARAFRDGGVVLLDEVHAADPGILATLNSALANGFMFVPHGRTQDTQKIRRHENTLIIASANTIDGQGYTSAQDAMDRAMLDRFVGAVHHVDYSREYEKGLLEKHGEKGVAFAEWVWLVRSVVQGMQDSLNLDVSTRTVEAIDSLMVAGIDGRAIIERVTEHWAEEDFCAVANGLGRMTNRNIENEDLRHMAPMYWLNRVGFDYAAARGPMQDGELPVSVSRKAKRDQSMGGGV